MFVRPQRYTSEVVNKEFLNFKIVELTLELKDPPEITFIPGQFISLEIDTGIYRAYSIASNSLDTKTIKLLIEVNHTGLGANYVRNLKVGDIVKFIGPSGRFYLPENLPTKIVLIATGTGYAPFEAILNQLVQNNYKGKIDLFFGVRNFKEVFKLDCLSNFQSKLENFNYSICVSQKEEKDKDLPNEYLGRVTTLVNTESNFIDSNSLYVLCGNPKMISEMIDLLELNNISKDNIIFEKFTN